MHLRFMFVAITALADINTRSVLTHVCLKLNSEQLVIETRLKIGEVITKITQQLGRYYASI